MLIRHKIIFLFVVFSGLLLLFFSFFIYFASANSRRNSFLNRIRNKALATEEIYEIHDKVAEKIIISIQEQSEYVFDINGDMIFSINDLHDFKFDSIFFSDVRKSGEYAFSYASTKTGDPKDGYALIFVKNGKQRIIVITAYNLGGFENLKSLASILIMGNLIFLTAVGLAAYVFSVRTFRPVKDLVAQAELVRGNDLNFRLTYANPNDEIGKVASSFNGALDRIKVLIESQKSFISYASHELRTPLTAINGILETSLQYDQDAVTTKESLVAARKEIQKAAGLVTSLLQLAKIESSGEIGKHVKLNIVDIILDAIGFFKLKIPTQEILFDIIGSGNNVSIDVNGQVHLLRTAFINIIDNASKYSNQQRIEIKLFIESSHAIAIKFIDHGIGILDEDNKHLFTPFYRGENATKVEGFGLGLSITKKIIDQHRGEITFQRNEFSGLTVQVSLPAVVSS